MANSSNDNEKIRVLLIDNDYFSDTLPINPNSPIKKYLTNYTAEIELLEAKTGKDGILKANTLNAHIVLIPADPPDMLPANVIRSIRETNSVVKIITMSYSNNPSWIRNTIQAGADSYACLPLIMDDDFYKLICKLYQRMKLTLKATSKEEAKPRDRNS